MIKTRIRQILRFSRYLLPYWDKQVALLVSQLFSTLFALVSPFLARLTIDYAYGRRDLQVYNALVIAGGIIWAISGLNGVVIQYVEMYIQQMLDLDLRREYYDHLQKLSLRFFQSRTTGEQMFRASSDIQGVAGFVDSTVPSVIMTVVKLVALLGISFWLHWRLTLIILAVTPIFYLHAHYFGNKQRVIYKGVVEKQQQISAELQEAISHAQLVKAFGREKAETRRYLRRWIERMRLSLDQTRMGIFSSMSGSLLNTVVVTGLSYYLGVQLIRGTVSLGTLIALTMYLFQLLNVLKSLGTIYSSVVVRFVSIDRLLETMDAEVEIQDAPDAVERVFPHGVVQFTNITFGYDRGEPVLVGVDLEMGAGQTVALVGPSGVGKTSLINLLLRFYDPWVGSVSIDGHDLRRVKLRSLRAQVSVALQDAMLMNTSILENIRFGRPEATDTEVMEAARMADVHEFIAELPRGYDTEIGEEGCHLSAGQKQRIAIARALIKGAKILILDEAMSSISSASERRILQALEETRRQRTTIIASHRLSTIRNADRIFVLEGNGIAEQGSHAELLAARGIYYELFAEQIGEAEAVAL